MKKTFYIILVFLAIFILTFLIEQIVILTHNETHMFFSFSLLMAIIGFLLARFGDHDISKYGVVVMILFSLISLTFVFGFIFNFLFR